MSKPDKPGYYLRHFIGGSTRPDEWLGLKWASGVMDDLQIGVQPLLLEGGVFSIPHRKHFWFEGNKAWGSCPAEWGNILDKYAGKDLMSALADPTTLETSLPSFGFTSEHVGPLSLGEFLAMPDQ